MSTSHHSCVYNFTDRERKAVMASQLWTTFTYTYLIKTTVRSRVNDSEHVFQKVTIPLLWGLFGFDPHPPPPYQPIPPNYPSGNSSFASYFPFKIWAFENSFPLEFPVALFRGGHGYFVELHIYSNRMYRVNLTLILNSFQGKCVNFTYIALDSVQDSRVYISFLLLLFLGIH